MTRILTVSLVTLGDPGRLTGGYLYHRRMAELAPACGAAFRFVSFPDRRFPLPALSGPAVLRRARADVLVLDSIAAAFLGPGWPVGPGRAAGGQPAPAARGDRSRAAAAGCPGPMDRLAYRRARLLVVASQAQWLAGQGFRPSGSGWCRRATTCPPLRPARCPTCARVAGRACCVWPTG